MLLKMKSCFRDLCLLFACFTLSHGQNRNATLNLCDSDGVYSCICDESTNSRNIQLMRVMCSFQNMDKITNNMIIPTNTDTLDFSVNNLTELSYVQMFDNINILVLYLNRNKINKIESGTFVDLSSLTELDLSENELNYLNPGVFHGVYKLKKLYLYSNKFKTFPQGLFFGLPVLEVLSLSNNDIGSFLTNTTDIFTSEGIYINQQITSLHLNNINMTQIPDGFFRNADNLRELYLKRNPLSTYPRLPFTLEVLDISGTQISSLDQSHFVYIPALKHLYMNDLENLKVIERYTFLPLRGLKTIQMQNCKRLTNLDKDVFGVNVSDTYLEFSVMDINLMGSGLQTLDEALLPLFSKLSNLDIRSNPWICNCKIIWMLGLQLNEQIKEQIRCERPPNLRGELMYSLKPKDLECRAWSSRALIESTTRIVLVILCIMLGGFAVWLIMVWSPKGHMVIPPTRLVGPDSPYSRITTVPPNIGDSEL